MFLYNPVVFRWIEKMAQSPRSVVDVGPPSVQGTLGGASAILTSNLHTMVYVGVLY